MKAEITLDNIHAFFTPLSEHPMKWMFEDEVGNLPDEFKNQIIPLTPEASKFLWEFKKTQRYLSSISAIGKYFNDHAELSFGENENQRVKKWLYEIGVPFSQKVFWISQPNTGFVMTWKMVVKFSEKLFFGNNEIIWDRSLNWALLYDHNGTFYFEKNRSFNAEKRSLEIEEVNRMIKNIRSSHQSLKK